MPPTDHERLTHMLEYSRDAVAFAAGRTKADLERDRMFAYAVVRCLEVVGAAASRITDTQRLAHPGIPWQDIRRTRDILSHVYFGIDYDIVWRTVTDDLPVLISILERVLQQGDPVEA